MIDMGWIMPGQQQRLSLPVWSQYKIIMSKEYAPLGAKAPILVKLSYIGQSCGFIPKKGHIVIDFSNFKSCKYYLYSSLGIKEKNSAFNLFEKKLLQVTFA